MAMTKKAAKPYNAMNKAELVRALTQRDRTIAKLEKRITETEMQPQARVDRGIFTDKPRTTLPRNPMPWECS